MLKFIKSNNGFKAYEGEIVEVTSVLDKGRVGKVTIVGTTKKFSIYQSSPGDEWILHTRVEMAEYLEAKNNDLRKEIEANDKEIERLKEFDSDEEEVAAKLELILKNPDRKSIAEILKTLKHSNYL